MKQNIIEPLPEKYQKMDFEELVRRATLSKEQREFEAKNKKEENKKKGD